MIPLSYRLERAALVEHPPGFDSDWRSFGNTLVTQVRSGEYRLLVGNQQQAVTPGMCFLMPPGVRHRVVDAGRQQPPTVALVHLHCRVYEAQGLFTVLDQPIIFPQALAQRIGACSDAIIACQDRGQRGELMAASVAVSTHLADIVAMALQCCPELEATWNRPEQTRLLPVLQYVQNHLSEPLTRGILAREAGLSEPHLHTEWVRAFGTAPMEMVRRERLQHARYLLHWSDDSIAAIAQYCGYPDPYYFSRTFSRAEGVSPSGYRRARRDQDQSHATT